MGRCGVVALCMLGLVATIPLRAGAAVWDELTDARVRDALQYGRDRASQPLEGLLEPWVARSADGRAAVVVKTDFIDLAHMGWNAQRSGQPVGDRDLDMETFVLRALASTLHLEGVVASSVIGLLEGVHLLDGRGARAAISFQFKIEAAEGSESVRFDAYFSSAGLTSASKIQVRILGSGGRQIVIPIDLARIP